MLQIFYTISLFFIIGYDIIFYSKPAALIIKMVAHKQGKFGSPYFLGGHHFFYCTFAYDIKAMQSEKTIPCPHCGQRNRLDKPKRNLQHEAYLMYVALELLKAKTHFHF